jgi:hypothetical protein
MLDEWEGAAQKLYYSIAALVAGWVSVQDSCRCTSVRVLTSLGNLLLLFPSLSHRS